MLIHGRTRPTCGTRIRQWLPRAARLYTLLVGPLRIDLRYRPRSGYRPVATWAVPVPGSATLDRQEIAWEPEMRRVSVTATAGAALPGAPSVSVLLSKLKTLVLHCCSTSYDDGSPRQPGWITIKTRGATWQVICKDPDGAASLEVEGKSLDDTLSLANELLGSENAAWAPDPYLQSRKPKKRK